MMLDFIVLGRLLAIALILLKLVLRAPDAVRAMRGDLSAEAARSLGMCILMIALVGNQLVFIFVPMGPMTGGWLAVRAIATATLLVAMLVLIGAWVVERQERKHREGRRDVWSRLYRRVKAWRR